MALKALLLAMGLWEVGVAKASQAERERKYAAAEEAARSRGKPLLVVGGPLGSSPLRWMFLPMRAHGCGDVCLDLSAESCRGCPTTIADVRSIPYEDGYFGAALASHVLEHLPTVDDAVKAVEELYRVADEVFVASPSKLSIAVWFHPGHHLWVKQDERGISIEPWPSA